MSRLAAQRLAIVGLTGVIFAAFSWGTGARLQAQQGPKVFLSAVDRNGAPITNLQPSDLKLVLDGVPCAATKVETINWPVKLTILIDNGEAMVNALTSMRDGLRSFLAEIPEGIETELLSYSPQPRWVVRPTTDRQLLLKGIDLVGPNPGAGSKFLDAAAEAMNRFVKEKGDAFHTMMIIASNGPEGSGGNWEGVAEKLRQQLGERPVVAHVVMLATSGLQSRSSGVTSQVGIAITQRSGGRYESVAVATILPSLLTEYGKQIARSSLLQSQQYRLSCDKSPSQAPRLSVLISSPSVADFTLTRDGSIP